MNNPSTDIQTNMPPQLPNIQPDQLTPLDVVDARGRLDMIRGAASGIAEAVGDIAGAAKAGVVETGAQTAEFMRQHGPVVVHIGRHALIGARDGVKSSRAVDPRMAAASAAKGAFQGAGRAAKGQKVGVAQAAVGLSKVGKSFIGGYKAARVAQKRSK